MSLPVPNLDDRRFQDLVDEAKRMIPQLCPEWTNHNVSDPGVALIELFAWMTEMTIFRLNQVPDAFYTHMLNLIGFEPFPATAAQTDLTFWLVAPVDEPIKVPAGTQVSTRGDIGESRVFATLDDLVITQPTLIGSLTASGPDQYIDVWDDLRIEYGAVVCFPRTPLSPGDAFYLGFESSVAGNVLQLSVKANVEGIGVVPDRPPLAWEVWQGEGWVPATVYRDSTGGLNRDGTIVMLVPNAHEPLTLSGVRAFWIRARLLPAEQGQPSYRASPQIRTLTAASVGGTVAAEHSDTASRAILGTSSGRPDQQFQVEHAPVLPRSSIERVLVVDAEGKEQPYEEVADFVNSGPGRSSRDVGLDHRRRALRAEHPLPRRLHPAARRRARRGIARRHHRLPLRRRRGGQRRAGHVDRFAVDDPVRGPGREPRPRHRWGRRRVGLQREAARTADVARRIPRGDRSGLRTPCRTG